MDASRLAAYRRRRGRTGRVREVPSRAAMRTNIRTEWAVGERVLADLPLAWDDALGTGRLLARYAAVHALSGGPDVAEARAALAEWEVWIRGTAEGRALTSAVRTLDPAVRYRGLRSAAGEAERQGHHASALALQVLAYDLACRLRRRRAARRAAEGAARSAEAAGVRDVAARWARRAARLAPRHG